MFNVEIKEDFKKESAAEFLEMDIDTDDLEQVPLYED